MSCRSPPFLPLTNTFLTQPHAQNLCLCTRTPRRWAAYGSSAQKALAGLQKGAHIKRRLQPGNGKTAEKSIFLRAQFPAKGGMCTIYVFCAFFGGCTRTHTSSRTPCHALVQRIVTQFWPTKKRKKNKNQRNERESREREMAEKVPCRLWSAKMQHNFGLTQLGNYEEVW